MSPIVESLLLRSSVIFLLTGSLAGLVVGVLLLWYPERLRMVSNVLNRWVSTRHLDESLERSIALDLWFYRYRRTSATLILLASGYILYFFSAGMDKESAIIAFSRFFALPPGLVGGLLDALVLSALLGALFAVLVSLFLLLRPSLLRDFERRANRWISMRRALKPMEISREGLDEYMFRHAREAGILLMLASLYVLVLLVTWVGH